VPITSLMFPNFLGTPPAQLQQFPQWLEPCWKGH
jgi:hypothetical protein